MAPGPGQHCLGPILGSNYPHNRAIGYFVNGDACMVHKYYLFVRIFIILNLYGRFSPENLLNLCIYLGFCSQTGVFLRKR